MMECMRTTGCRHKQRPFSPLYRPPPRLRVCRCSTECGRSVRGTCEKAKARPSFVHAKRFGDIDRHRLPDADLSIWTNPSAFLDRHLPTIVEEPAATNQVPENRIGVAAKAAAGRSVSFLSLEKSHVTSARCILGNAPSCMPDERPFCRCRVAVSSLRWRRD